MLQETIQNALKTGNVIIGFEESIKYIKINRAKLIVIANNIPENIKNDIEHNAKISKTRIEVYPSNSKDLGVICGKPFPVTTLVIKG